jgi:molybdopterin synthase catalytic subunit
MPAIVRITRESLDAKAVRALEESVTTSGDGGVVTFQGVVRDNARGKQVRLLCGDGRAADVADRR